MTNRSAAVTCLLAMAAGVAVDVACGDALLLHGGRVVSGSVTRNDSVYVVSTAGGRRAYPAENVLMQGESVDGLYRKLAHRTFGQEQHLKLAEWCVENALQSRAIEQLDQCRRTDPRVVRLREKADAIVTTSAEQVAPPKETRTTAFGLSPETVRMYRRKVSPLIRNACGGAACHGPSAAVPLHASPVAMPNETRAMIAAALRRVAPLDPSGSPLVRMAVTPHGGSSGSPLKGPAASRQAELLATWASRAAAEAKRP